MSAYVRQISIAGNGGKVRGSWFKDGTAFSGVPALKQNDTLQVVAQMASGNSAPASLTGYMIIGPAPAVSETQNDASPFLQGNNQICVQTFLGVMPTGGNTFTFAPPLSAPNPGPVRRQFELTFVAVDPSGKQYEEDPEFDTST